MNMYGYSRQEIKKEVKLHNKKNRARIEHAFFESVRPPAICFFYNLLRDAPEDFVSLAHPLLLSPPARVIRKGRREQLAPFTISAAAAAVEDT